MAISEVKLHRAPLKSEQNRATAMLEIELSNSVCALMLEVEQSDSVSLLTLLKIDMKRVSESMRNHEKLW